MLSDAEVAKKLDNDVMLGSKMTRPKDGKIIGGNEVIMTMPIRS